MTIETSPSAIVLKAPFSMKVSAIVSALAAFFSMQTALGVYQGEKYRLELERLKTTYEANLEYTKFGATETRLLPCIVALMDLNDDDVLTSVLRTPTKDVVLKYDAGTHAALKKCPGNEGLQPTNGMLTLTSNQPFQQKLDVRLDHLDALLVTYRYDIGRKEILCASLLGIMMNAHGKVGDFFLKLVDLDIIRSSNFPHVAHFLEDFRSMPVPKTCQQYAAPQLERNVLLDALSWIMLKLKI